MTIKALGGLVVENFAKTEPYDEERLDIQAKLCEEGLSSGVQLRVGHDFTNKQNIKHLKKAITYFKLPFFVHGAAENLGVDLGQTFDELGKFNMYSETHSKVSWSDYNISALKNSALIAKLKNSLDPRVVIHPGYHGTKSGDFLNSFKLFQNSMSGELKKIPFSLETIPAFVIGDSKEKSDKSSASQYIRAFGGTPENMEFLVAKARENTPNSENLDVLIDFTHIQVTSNQMELFPNAFAMPRDNYAQLVEDFLSLPVSNFTHFSGFTPKLYDEHNGFFHKSHKNSYNQKVVHDALQELDARFSEKGKDVYVALEMRFNELDESRRQMDYFLKHYAK